MGVQRKCLNCNTWNGEESHCIACGLLIDPVLIENEREKLREVRRNSIPPTKLDLFLLSWKNSRFHLVRVLYIVLYSIAVTFIAIASFFAWLAATPNG